ncbi:MAG: glycosyltransferase [Acidimicrobiia bacterium]|nr:glycosyltransferase [Acidimicrobiia bacterium]
MIERLVAPENDYQPVRTRERAGDLTVGVAIPTFNQGSLLDRTLASMVSQTRKPDQIVVADDGSTEDIRAIVDRYADLLPVSYVRQEFEGRGAGPARNLAASLCNTDVYLFCDSDCAADPGLIETHMFWHERASNLVVAGSRLHVDSTDITPEQIRAGNPLSHLAHTPVDDGAETEDWRRWVGRRAKNFTIGDTAYRATLSSNLSVGARVFDEVGGFLDIYTEWGGEDTELGWRLWNSGCFVVPDRRAIVYHQVQDDPPYDATRQASRNRTRVLMADRIPHRFYRVRSTPVATVPKLSWIIPVASPDSLTTAFERVATDAFADAELVLVGPEAAVEAVKSLDKHSRRVKVVVGSSTSAVAVAIMRSDGEFVALRDPRITVNSRLVTKAVQILDDDPRIAAVRVAYRVANGPTFRTTDDLDTVDGAAGWEGLPLLAVVRKREIMKDRRALDSASPLWPNLFDRINVRFLINDHAELPASLSIDLKSRYPRLGDVAKAGPREVVRAVTRSVGKITKQRASAPPVARTQSSDNLVGIDYIGYTGAGNLGDEAMLVAVRQLLPWADVQRDHPNPAVIMVGGGTLINGKGYYLTRVLRRDSPRLEKVVFGTGVRSPDYWGSTEDVTAWAQFFDAALYTGVRGPLSQAHLADFGYKTPVDVLGDPALSLPRPDVARVPGRVVVCPVWTSGNLHGGDDDVVFDGLAGTIQRLRAAGHEVVMMSAFNQDDRYIIDLMRRANASDMPYVPAHLEVADALDLIASADLVIAERLHAGILAAAMGTAFIPIEYRPKTRDFAQSVGVDDLVVRTDNFGALDERVDEVLNAPNAWTSTVATAVEAFRIHQTSVASRLQIQLSNPDPQPWLEDRA